MRLIDADALKKEYRMADRCEDCKRNSRDCQHVYSWTLMDVCSMLDDAPTIGGWISVKDRLPEEHERILTYDKYSDVKENRLLRSYPCVSWAYGFHVTHWMPLPEPPEEDATSGNH